MHAFGKTILGLGVLLTGCFTDAEDPVTLSPGIYEGPSEFQSNYKHLAQLDIRAGGTFEIQDMEYAREYKDGQYTDAYTDLVSVCRTSGEWEATPDSLLLNQRRKGCAYAGGRALSPGEITNIGYSDVHPDSARRVYALRNVTEASFQALVPGSVPLKWNNFIKL